LDNLNKLETKLDLEYIFVNYKDLVYRSILFKVNMNKELAEDLTQETFIRSWKYRNTFNSEKSNIKTWLVTIARNICIDNFKKNKVKIYDIDNFEDQIHSDDLLSEQIEKDLLNMQILKHLVYLNGKDREILSLRYIEDFSLKEIAEIQKKRYVIIKVAANRALKKLKNLIENENRK
jgi:RNA polymerase sigma-70 factor (ECF subfamily)